MECTNISSFALSVVVLLLVFTWTRLSCSGTCMCRQNGWSSHAEWLLPGCKPPAVLHCKNLPHNLGVIAGKHEAFDIFALRRLAIVNHRSGYRYQCSIVAAWIKLWLCICATPKSPVEWLQIPEPTKPKILFFCRRFSVVLSIWVSWDVSCQLQLTGSTVIKTD